MNDAPGEPPRKWVLKRFDDAPCDKFCNEFGLHPLTAQLLCQRGICDVEAADAFLNPSLSHMIDPLRMKGAKRAVHELVRALDAGDRVVIYGDYDVDGVCSAAVLYSFLRDLGGDVDYHIPRRDQDGYGLAARAVRRLVDDGCKVLVTADCGVSNVEEVELARQLGLRVIVVDHHSPPDSLPAAHAILNPLQPDCDYPFGQLAAVGVSFNLVVALRRDLRSRGVFKHVSEPDVRTLLDLVALGTIADVVPLVGQNRMLVRHGLKVVAGRKRAGIAALMEQLSGSQEPVDTQTVSFGLAPRLNAAGRMGDATMCVELLTTRSDQRALELAGRLDELNVDRRAVESDILQAALPRAQAQVDAGRKILVVAGVEWSGGVLGIVASRLTERYHRPAIVVGLQDGTAQGSGRSIEGIDLLGLLDQSADLLTTYGGHTAAAGVSLDADRLDALGERINDAADQMLSMEPLPRPQVSLDGVVDLGSLDEQFVDDLARLEPFGMGNAEPIFVAPHSQASSVRIVGDNHLRARFRDGTGSLEGIGFSLGGLQGLLDEPVAVAFSPRYSVFRGRGRLEMRLEDVRRATDDVVDCIDDFDS